MLSLTDSDGIPRALVAKAASRTRTQTALLAVLVLAAAAGCSSTSGTSNAGGASNATGAASNGTGASSVSRTSSVSTGSSSGPSADQQAVAAVAARTLHDLGDNDYTDLCTIIAPGSSILASGIEGCAEQAQLAMTGAGGQSGAEAFLSKASELTVDASEVVVDGDSATVPKTAILYQGQPVTQFQGMGDENLIRKDGQWYLVMGD